MLANRSAKFEESMSTYHRESIQSLENEMNDMKCMAGAQVQRRLMSIDDEARHQIIHHETQSRMLLEELQAEREKNFSLQDGMRSPLKAIEDDAKLIRELKDKVRSLQSQDLKFRTEIQQLRSLHPEIHEVDEMNRLLTQVIILHNENAEFQQDRQKHDEHMMNKLISIVRITTTCASSTRVKNIVFKTSPKNCMTWSRGSMTCMMTSLLHRIGNLNIVASLIKYMLTTLKRKRMPRGLNRKETRPRLKQVHRLLHQHPRYRAKNLTRPRFHHGHPCATSRFGNPVSSKVSVLHQVLLTRRRGLIG